MAVYVSKDVAHALDQLRERYNVSQILQIHAQYALADAQWVGDGTTALNQYSLEQLAVILVQGYVTEEDDHTGYWGIWNPWADKFVLGIQEKSRWRAQRALLARLGKEQVQNRQHWYAKRISVVHAPMFYDGLKFKNGKVAHHERSINRNILNESSKEV